VLLTAEAYTIANEDATINSKVGSKKTLNSRQTRIFTTENNYSDYMQEQ